VSRGKGNEYIDILPKNIENPTRLIRAKKIIVSPRALNLSDRNAEMMDTE
jgi:hypothetical protein